MPIALTDELRELAAVATGFLANRDALTAARALLDADTEELPAFWDELVSMGWLGLHLPEDVGGSGYGLGELAVVLEALGSVAAPGPFLPTVIASAIIATCGSDVQRKTYLPGLADGSLLGAVALEGTVVRDSHDRITGDAGLVLGGGHAQLVIVRLGEDLGLLRLAPGAAVPVDTIDPTRRCARITLDGAMIDETGFMAQTGDPKGDGTGGSKYPDLPAEFTPTPFKRGAVEQPVPAIPIRPTVSSSFASRMPHTSTETILCGESAPSRGNATR